MFFVLAPFGSRPVPCPAFLRRPFEKYWLMGVRSPNHALFVLSRPPLLLVVGMHRSGTSLLGGILERWGVGLPGETISGDHHNPEGYFEWADVVDLQERLLIDLDRWWPAPEGTLALPDGWIQHPATRKVYGKLLVLVAAAVDQQQGLWAIKDRVAAV